MNPVQQGFDPTYYCRIHFSILGQPCFCPLCYVQTALFSWMPHFPFVLSSRARHYTSDCPFFWINLCEQRLFSPYWSNKQQGKVQCLFSCGRHNRKPFFLFLLLVSLELCKITLSNTSVVWKLRGSLVLYGWLKMAQLEIFQNHYFHSSILMIRQEHSHLTL